MAKVYVRIEEAYVYNDEGREVEGLIATCTHCNRVTQAYGRSDGSRTRCIMKMKEECREEDRGHKATNYYMAD